MQGSYEVHAYTEEVPGGTFEIRISKQEHDLEDKKSMMNLWVRNGYLPRPLPETLSVETLFTKDGDGSRYRICDPTVKNYPTGPEIDFAWMLPPTPENEKLIVKTAMRMAKGQIPQK